MLLDLLVMLLILFLGIGTVYLSFVLIKVVVMGVIFISKMVSRLITNLL